MQWIIFHWCIFLLEAKNSSIMCKHHKFSNANRYFNNGECVVHFLPHFCKASPSQIMNQSKLQAIWTLVAKFPNDLSCKVVHFNLKKYIWIKKKIIARLHGTLISKRFQKLYERLLYTPVYQKWYCSPFASVLIIKWKFIG